MKKGIKLQLSISILSLLGGISLAICSLTEQTAVVKRSMKEWVALSHGSYPGHKNDTALLVSLNHHVHTQDTDGFTLLHTACQNGYETVVALLLQAGADKNARTKNTKHRLVDWEVMHASLLQGYALNMTLFMKNSADNGCVTPLHLAAQNGHEQIVALLLKAGADSEYEDESGNTPLSCALDMVVKKRTVRAYRNIIYMLLRAQNESLSTSNRYSWHAHNLLKTWGFDQPTFRRTLEKSKELSKEHYKACVALLEDYNIPTVITALIIGYHQCLDTEMLLFSQAKSLTSSCKPQKCIVQ